jgi:HAD superfamily hydrolase (TIGR01484 family)
MFSGRWASYELNCTLDNMILTWLINISSLHMKRTQVNALLSDYDGTLCPTASVRGDGSVGGTIPKELEQILFCISKRIPMCIISSKDFAFLHKRTGFANILSCVLGIESVIHNPHHNTNNEISNFDCIRYQHLIASSHSLLDNSKLLYDILKLIQNRKDITIEEKYTSDKEILIGLTIDYRHLKNWKLFKENTEPILREMIQRRINANLAPNISSKDIPFIQEYSSHPFLDVYGVRCNKGLAFNSVLSQLRHEEIANVMYLGDSENDNPAFRKSDIPIGIRSDARLNPMLDCNYMLDFNQLPLFLRGLIDNNYIFSEELLSVG